MLFKEEELNRKIEDKKQIVILTHKSPDGDAIGSSLGLMHVLRNSGRQAHIVLNGQVPDGLAWLPESQSMIDLNQEPQKARQYLDSADLLFFLDFNVESRMGEPLRQWVQEVRTLRQTPIVMIDHHPYPTADVDLLYSDTSKSATAELLAQLLGLPERPSEHCNASAANCLYTGIMTDTGLFRHNCYRAELFDVVASLLRLGADHECIVQKTFHSDKIARQQLLGYILNKKICYDEAHHWAIFSLTQEELKQFGIQDSDTDGLVNIPLEAQGIEMSVFLRETPEHEIKLSFRSTGTWAVNQVAQEAFGGGGHRNAAGAEYKGNLSDALQIVQEHLLRLVEASQHSTQSN